MLAFFYKPLALTHLSVSYLDIQCQILLDQPGRPGGLVDHMASKTRL